MPSVRRVNQHEKLDRLPSLVTMADAHGDILAWWQTAWLEDASLGPRFLREAAAALVVEADPNLNEIYAALEWRRLRLRQDQQGSEWTRLRAQVPRLAITAGATLP